MVAIALYLLYILSSCSKEQLPVQHIQEVGKVANKDAHTQTVYTFDFTGSKVINQCNGEMMTATTWNVTVRSSRTITNNKVLYTTHITTQFKMVGESGTIYTGTTNYVDHSRTYSNGTASLNIKIREHVTAIGKGGDLFYTYLCSVVTHPDGTITYTKSPYQETVCK